MEVWIRGQDQYNFGKSEAGGLEINGECTGIPANQISNLIIHGDSLSNKIDLRGMKKEDFPDLATVSDDIYERTAVFGEGGDDEIFGHDPGALIDGGGGNDYLEGGEKGDHLYGGTGEDHMYGKGGKDTLRGGSDDDYLNGGADEDILEGEGGNDVLVGDNSDKKIDAGPGDDSVTTIKNEGESPPIQYQVRVYKSSLVQGNCLFITDSSGVDTLDFSLFEEGIVLDLNLFDTPQIYTKTNDTLALYGIFEYFRGTAHNDVISIDPDSVAPRYVDGKGSADQDTLYVDCMGEECSDDGHTITIQGYQPISYENFEHCIITNKATEVVNGNIDRSNDNHLFQMYPNPFNSSATFRFSLKEKSTIKLDIYDVHGSLVKNIANEEYATGNYEITFNGKEFATGIYYVHLHQGEFITVKKMILLE